MDELVQETVASKLFNTVQAFRQVNYDKVERLTTRALKSSGTVHISGLGNSTLVAKLVAQTLISLNIKSSHLHAIDALHGDIGAVHSEDTVLLLSESGEAPELVELVHALRSKQCFVVVLTGREDGKLREICDLCILLSNTSHTRAHVSALDEFESMLLSDFDYLALLLLDAWAIHLISHTGLTKEQYAQNHPSGKIGRHLRLKAGDVMIPWQELPLVKSASNGLSVLVEFASKSKGYGCVLVVDDQRQLQGTISDADFRRAFVRIGQQSIHMPTGELMNFSKKFPRTCSVDDLAIDALTKMNEQPKVEYLPVLKNERLEGLITTRVLQRQGI